MQPWQLFARHRTGGSRKLAPVLACSLPFFLVSGCQKDVPQPPVRAAIWTVNGDVVRAQALLAADRAGAHGLDPDDYRPADGAAFLAAAARSPAGARTADVYLNKAYLRWASDIAEAGTHNLDLVLSGAAAANRRRSARTLLHAAAATDDTEKFLAQMERRHPVYDRIRIGLADARAHNASASRIELLERNLVRARLLPLSGRHILVDAASQRLWFVENGVLTGDMRVVVGSPATPTPLMAGVIDHVVAKPYWHVPEDLAQQRIAPEVVRGGPGYLTRGGYQVLSDWSDNAVPVRASSINWKAAAAARESVRVRQLPGPGNMMGQMKFMFPNELGIYLHDTPKRHLFAQANRTQSAGCVRVADWQRLARWLFAGAVPDAGTSAEHEIRLPTPVVLHISYFTVDITKPELPAIADVYHRDVYHRDAVSRQL